MPVLIAIFGNNNKAIDLKLEKGNMLTPPILQNLEYVFI